jgi:transcription initiation factor IIE alpha subunit
MLDQKIRKVLDVLYYKGHITTSVIQREFEISLNRSRRIMMSLHKLEIITKTNTPKVSREDADKIVRHANRNNKR